jgi:hypothetical protein
VSPSDVSIRTPRGEMPAHLATPAGDGPYHEPSSRDARRRISAFFRSHLG